MIKIKPLKNVKIFLKQILNSKIKKKINKTKMFKKE